MDFLLTLVYYLCQLLSVAVFARALLSWFPLGYNNPIVIFIFNVTEPLLIPVRRIIPRLGLLDISPMVAIVALQIIAWAVRQI